MSGPAIAILERCRSLGFALAGIASADATQYERELRAWLAAGRHGTMGYLERNVEALVDPQAIVPGARSVICVADRYAHGRRDVPTAPGRGRIARYARGRDYHKVIRRRLHDLADALRAEYPNETFRACVDTAPVLEREYAQRAGLGAVGKHTVLIERGAGSWLFLGEIVTTMRLSPSRPAPPDPCGSCTRCIDACPTDAITPWSVDATRCVSYLTIEHRARIDPGYHQAHGDWLFGCDICLEVCPHSHPTRKSRRLPVHDAYQPNADSFDLLDVLDWDAEKRLQQCAGSSMTRAKLPMMKRNALIVAGNALRENELPELRARIEELTRDEREDELVRETARLVLARIGHDRSQAYRRPERSTGNENTQTGRNPDGPASPSAM